MIKNYRKTKILATIGPSSEKITKIEKLISSGVDAFRINCSHTTESQFESYIKNSCDKKDDLHFKVGDRFELVHIENED